jgi:hypothetical protein
LLYPPDAVSPLEGQQKWIARWKDRRARFDRSPRAAEISPSTRRRRPSAAPPPRSRVFYHPCDLVAFSSVRDPEVFYPMKWDDNGLPTERRVQNYGVRCGRRCLTTGTFRRRAAGFGGRSVSRPNFIELCARLAAGTRRRSGISGIASAYRSTGR